MLTPVKAPPPPAPTPCQMMSPSLPLAGCVTQNAAMPKAAANTERQVFFTLHLPVVERPRHPLSARLRFGFPYCVWNRCARHENWKSSPSEFASRCERPGDVHLLLVAAQRPDRSADLDARLRRRQRPRRLRTSCADLLAGGGIAHRENPESDPSQRTGATELSPRAARPSRGALVLSPQVAGSDTEPARPPRVARDTWMSTRTRSSQSNRSSGGVNRCET